MYKASQLVEVFLGSPCSSSSISCSLRLLPLAKYPLLSFSAPGPTISPLNDLLAFSSIRPHLEKHLLCSHWLFPLTTDFCLFRPLLFSPRCQRSDCARFLENSCRTERPTWCTHRTRENKIFRQNNFLPLEVLYQYSMYIYTTRSWRIFNTVFIMVILNITSRPANNNIIFYQYVKWLYY